METAMTTNAHNLLVPYGGQESIILTAVNTKPITIPCLATSSRAKVTLWRINKFTKNAKQIEVSESSKNLKYDKTKGFQISPTSWDFKNENLYCKAETDNYVLLREIFIYFTYKTFHLLSPHISLNSDVVYVGETLTMSCEVTVELGVATVIEWRFPSAISEERMKQNLERSEKESFVTIKNKLIISDVMAEDEGWYTCNVNLVGQKTFSTKKFIFVYKNEASNFEIHQSFLNFTHDFKRICEKFQKVLP
ncbi:hypothetical protein B4U79_18442 [Dinothrombium tinctorium]|uniref:Platelet-derived growth factor receptor-like protein n=1 Tax=Dinothrombium tinctorium TaxID=1965070 RepID=A0A443QJM4_9ACAR|nr:hypothetical protein B4U79_18442 [Dinothrombium tinctorium]